MKNSSLSMLVFAVYLTILGLLCMFFPGVGLYLGFDDVSGPWIRILGYVVLALAFFYFMAVRDQARNFYRWSVYARLPLALYFGILVVSNIAPPILLLIGIWDTCCALWTAVTLKNEMKKLNTIA